LVENPDVDVAAEAVEKDYGGAFALADLEVLDGPAVYVYLLGFGAAHLFLFGDERLLELLDVGVYLLVRNVRRGDYA
jgi:hypothetical protein